MSLKPASSALSDAEFLAAVRACSLPPACFRHGDHLRLAWLHIHQHPLEVAAEHVRNDIQAYANHLGSAEFYHETMTVAWVRLIASHDEQSFDEFLRLNAHRLNKELLHRFWSPELLESETARLAWVDPDRLGLPMPAGTSRH